MALQIKGKFISSQAVDGTKLLLTSGQAIRLMTATGEVRLIELDESTGKVKVNGVAVALSPELIGEVNRALAAEAALAADLATEVSNRQVGDAATLTSAQAYVDQKVADLVASAPAVLDTLKELADALGGDANFASTISGQIGAANAAVAAEATRALNAEIALQGEVDAVEAALVQEINDRTTAVSAETSRAQAAEAGLQSQIDSISGGNGSMSLTSLDARLDTLEGSSSEVGSVAYAVATETAARQAADTALSTAVQALIQAEADARVAEDSALDARVDALESAGIASQAAVDALDSRLDVIEGDATVEGSVAKAEADAKDYADAAVLVEKTRAEGAESALDARLDVIEGVGAGSIAKAQADAQSYADAAVLVEKTRAEAAESALDGRLDVLEGTGAGSVAKAEADAKAYADTKIAALVNSAPEVLDTLQELAAAINNDASFAATVAGQIGSVSSSLSAEVTRATNAEAALQAEIDAEESARAAAVFAEKTRAEAAEAVLDGRLDTVEAGLAQELVDRAAADTLLDDRLDALEARLHRKMKFTLSATDISNGYIELAHEAMANSIVASVGRLMIHEGVGEDFTVSVSVDSGKTRMTFVGNLVSPSEEQLAAGDVIFVKYMNV